MKKEEDNDWEEDVDSTIYIPKEELPEEWIPTYKQRAIAGLVIAAIYILIALPFWEISLKAATVGAILSFSLTMLLGEKFVKFICFIVELFGIG